MSRHLSPKYLFGPALFGLAVTWAWQVYAFTGETTVSPSSIDYRCLASAKMALDLIKLLRLASVLVPTFIVTVAVGHIWPHVLAQAQRFYLHFYPYSLLCHRWIQAHFRSIEPFYMSTITCSMFQSWLPS